MLCMYIVTLGSVDLPNKDDREHGIHTIRAGSSNQQAAATGTERISRKKNNKNIHKQINKFQISG